MRILIVLLTPFLMGFHGHPDIWWEAERDLCRDLQGLLTDMHRPTEEIGQKVKDCEKMEEDVRLLPPVEYHCLALKVCPE